MAKALTPEEARDLIDPKVLSEAVRKSAYLSPALRERMLESLKFDLNPKYRIALGAYIKAVAGKPKAEEKEEGTESGTNE